METAIDAPRNAAARVAGLMYLFLLVTAALAEFGVRGGIVVPDAAATAANIAGDERLYRLGIALDLVAAPGNVVLAVALYVLLRPVHRHLALVAAFWRVAEATALGVITLASFVILELVDDADTSVAAAFVDAHTAGYAIGLIFFSLGSTVFNYLLYRSGLLPRPLALLGLAAAPLLLACMYTFIVFPGAQRFLIPACYAPIGVFELTIGAWLLMRRLPERVAA